MEEAQMQKGLSDAVLIEIVHGLKDIIILLIEKLCLQKQHPE
jgi:hypothetical protein